MRSALGCALLVLLAWVGQVQAQTVTGAAFRLTSGPCTVRSGSGVPSTSLGSACDVYVRLDSPYGVYHKLDATTWVRSSPGTGSTGDLFFASSATEFGRLSAVAAGQVLASAGTGTAPAWTGTPTISGTVTLNGTPGFLVSATNAQIRLSDSDAAVDNKNWVIRAENEAFTFRANNDALNAGSTFFNVERTGTTIDNMTLSPSGGDIILAPGGLDVLPDTGYTKNLGALTNKFLTLHAAELWVETLVAQNTMATIGGRILVGPTTTLTSDLASGATSMVVKHNSIANGDRVVLQANGQLEWIAVTSAASGAGPYTYSITRNLDGSGANDWSAGDAVFNTGTTGNGFIDLYSVAGVIPGSTAGPTIVGNVRTGTTYSQVEPRWAVGNLNGLYGYGATTYGAAFGSASATNVTVDATNGFRIRNSTTDKFVADTSGNLSIVGDLSVGTSGVIRSGATAFATGTGYWLDYNAGTPRFRVGTTAGDRVAWDGSNLVIQSTNLVADSSGVRIAPSTSTTFSNVRGYTFTNTTGSMGLFGFDASGTGRHSSVRTDWTGTGDFSGVLLSSIGSANLPSSGGTNYSAVVSTNVDPGAGLAYVQITATTYTDFSADLRIYNNNGSTTSLPYMRSDGNYLVVDSRSAANGGALYLNNDTNAPIYLGYGNGNYPLTYIYTPYFVQQAPRWATSLTQATVGASGAASALPANPAGYIKVADASGNVFVVPVYNP